MSAKYSTFVVMNVFITILMFVATMYITVESIRSMDGAMSEPTGAPRKAELCLEPGCLVDDLVDGPQVGECHIGAYTRSIAMAVVSFLGGGLLNARGCKVVPPL